MLFCSSADPTKIERALRESVELLKSYEPDQVIVTVGFRIYLGCDLVWIATREGIIGAGANLPEHVGIEPFPEFHHPLLMAGGTEMTALAGKGQKIFMVAIPALYPGKAVVQVATVQVAVNDLLKVGPPEPVRPFEPLLVDLNKGFNSMDKIQPP